MSSLIIHIQDHNGHKAARKFNEQKILIGSGAECNLRVPFSWFGPKPIEIQNQAGILRIRSLSDTLTVEARGQSITGEWTLLAEKSDILIKSGQNKVTISLHSIQSSGAVVLSENRASPNPDAVLYSGATVFDVSGNKVEEKPLSIPAPTEIKAHPAPKSHAAWYTAIAVVLVVVTLISFFLLGADVFKRDRQRDQKMAEYKQFRELITTTERLSNEGKYKEAKLTLLDAEKMAQSHAWQDEINEVRTLMASPEIQFGGNGYEVVHGKWVEPAVAAAWREAESQYDPKIDQLLIKAKSTFEASDYAGARVSCAEAMECMAKFPDAAKPHRRMSEIQQIDKVAENQIVAKDMLAKGMVLYKDRWMTPAEEFRAQQLAKGLAEYKGQWLSKDAAFAAEQTDKGLVLFNGKWMTPDEKKEAEGLVKFEGKWITTAERGAIVGQREKERQAKAAEDERKRQEAIQLAEARKKQEAEINKRKPDAYVMSQKFIKDSLKHPLSAEFRPYTDDDVIVVYKDGWYLVKAPVRAENGLGTLISRFYICKLRLKTGDTWESELTSIVDE